MLFKYLQRSEKSSASGLSLVSSCLDDAGLAQHVCWSKDGPHSHSIPHENIFGSHVAKSNINIRYECFLILTGVFVYGTLHFFFNCFKIKIVFQILNSAC